MAAELESYLPDTGPGQEVASYFSAGKTQLVYFDCCNNTGATDVKMDGSVLEEKSSFKFSLMSVKTAQFLRLFKIV